MSIYCLASVHALVREYIPMSVYHTSTEWYQTLLSAYLESSIGKHDDILVDASRWAQGSRKIPLRVLQYYATAEGRMLLAQTVLEWYMPYIIDVARLAQRLDQLVRADDILGRAISEYLGRLYPCHTQQDYAGYIAAVLYYAMDRLPG